jgi:predicted RNase H-like nuclease (RuvC/YqgF family)
MPDRPLDDLAATLSGEINRFLSPRPGPDGERPAPIKAEPLVQLLMAAAARAQDGARQKAEAARTDDGTRRELDQLRERVEALAQDNRALERQLAKLEGYVEGLRAQLAAGGKRHKDD